MFFKLSCLQALHYQVGLHEADDDHVRTACGSLLGLALSAAGLQAGDQGKAAVTLSNPLNPFLKRLPPSFGNLAFASGGIEMNNLSRFSTQNVPEGSSLVGHNRVCRGKGVDGCFAAPMHPRPPTESEAGTCVAP